MPTDRVVPEAIKTHPQAWFWKPAWKRMHCRRQQFNAAICGRSGSGKSYAALYAAWLLDRNSDNKPRFSLDQIAFDVQQFFEIADRKLAIGSAVVLDDTALAALSSETLKTEVRELTKSFISMRHRRLCVLLTFPAISMISKNILRCLLYYIEMKAINEQTNQSKAVGMRMQTNAISGKIYYHKFTFMHERFCQELGLTISRKYFRPPLTFDLPPKELVDGYEKVREKRMKAFRASSKETVEGKKKVKRTFKDDYETVKGSLQQFLDKKGKVDRAKLMLYGLSEYRAKGIKKLIDEERKSVQNRVLE